MTTGTQFDYLVFTRFDPLLKMALELLRAQPSDYKAVSKILDAVLNELNQIVKLETDLVKQALTIVYDYVTLPSLLVLERLRLQWDVMEAKDRIQQQLHWKASLIACNILICLYNHLGTIEEEKVVKCGCILGRALPDRDSISAFAKSDYIDKGQTTMQGILKVLHIVGERSNAIYQSFGGMWLAGVTDSSIAITEYYKLDEPVVETALSTIEGLLRGTDQTRRFFPGIFSGLYRCIFRSFKEKGSAGVVATRALTKLLDVTLANPPASKTSLESLIHSSQTETDDVFWSQVKQRMPSTLVVLIGTLSTCKSDSLRYEACNLFASIWKTRHIWSSELIYKLVDAVLLVSQTTEPRILERACSLKNDMREDTQLAVETLSARLFSLLSDDLIILAKAKRYGEFRAKCKLAQAYLDWSAQTCKKSIRNFLNDAKSIWRTIICLLQYDSKRTDQSSLLVEVDKERFARPPDPPSLLLDRDAEKSLCCMIESLGEALGPKLSLLLIDQLICDVIVSADSGALFDLRFKHLADEYSSVLRLGKLLVSRLMHEPSSKTKYVQKMADTLVPLLFSNVFWRETIRYLPVTNLPSSFTDGDQQVNESILYSTMDFISEIAKAIGAGARSLLPSILYPLVELNSFRRGVLQAMSLYLLNEISLAIDGNDIAHLLEANRTLLSSEILGKVRTAASEAALVKVTLSCTKLLHFSRRRLSQSDCSNFGVASSFVLFGLSSCIDALLDAFDQLGSETSLKASFAQVALIEMALGHMNDWVTVVNDSIPETRDRASESHPWLDCLDNFKLIAERSFRAVVSNASGSVELVPPYFFEDQVRRTNSLMSKACYFFSHSSLFIQSKCVASLTPGFKFLSKLQHVIRDSDEENGPKTAILRQVATLWPSIHARVRHCENILFDEKASPSQWLTLVPDDRTGETEAASRRYLLASLFELIGVIGASSGDFFFTRYRDHVIPVLGKSLGHYNQQIPKRLVDSDRVLLVSIIRSIEEAFGDKSFAADASLHVPLIGQILLPFLDHEDSSVCDQCRTSLRVIVASNPDAILRELYELSGRRLGSCPLSDDGAVNESGLDIVVESLNASKLGKYATELLNFIYQLPESPL